MSEKIVVKGAREHNLKNIDVELPRNKLVVVTGLSGSGKSSLAFDTIYAEGQRRYVESLSSYARQFLGLMEKPDVDQIDGLSPAISIDQKSTSRNPRSTVATVTEIYDYLRLLFARIGVPHCPVCGKTVTRQTTQNIVDQITHLPDDARLLILAPVVLDKKGAFEHIPEQFQRAGFARARVDGVVYALDEFPTLDKNYKHTIEIVIDRLVNNDESRTRLAQSVEQALEVAEGKVRVANADTDQEALYSLMYACIDHPDVAIPELEPRTFSFNSPHGACPVCTGLGSRLEVDPELVIPNGRLTVAEGAIRPFNRVNADAWYMKKMQAVAERYNFSLHVPTGELKKEDLDRVLYGTGAEKYKVSLLGLRHRRPCRGVEWASARARQGLRAWGWHRRWSRRGRSTRCCRLIHLDRGAARERRLRRQWGRNSHRNTGRPRWPGRTKRTPAQLVASDPPAQGPGWDRRERTLDQTGRRQKAEENVCAPRSPPESKGRAANRAAAGAAGRPEWSATGR